MDVMAQPMRVVKANGTQAWYLHGLLHRVDAPAVIKLDGSQVWYVHGVPHRTDGPAWIHPDGTQAWYVHGKMHRSDGPAMIHATGSQSWYVHDENISHRVVDWMQHMQVSWPWDAHTQAQFVLTFA